MSARRKVLVVSHTGGRYNRIEVYADQDVDVRIVSCPEMKTQAGEILAEQWLEGELPFAYRCLYEPGCLRAEDAIRPVRPSDIARAEWEVEFLQTLDKADRLINEPF